MNFSFRAKLFASAIALSAIPLVVTTFPCSAQEVALSFDAFHDALQGYGDWVYSDRWGEVWIPADVPDDFRPYYSDGHWVNTEEYGLLWISSYDWGVCSFIQSGPCSGHPGQKASLFLGETGRHGIAPAPPVSALRAANEGYSTLRTVLPSRARPSWQ
jgi:Family of unknown function (DUF6600)